MKKRSVLLIGHATSVSLEEPFWDALKAEAAARGQTLRALVEEIDRQRSGPLSSTLRLFVLQALQERLKVKS